MLIDLFVSICIYKLMKRKYVIGRFININVLWFGFVYDVYIFRIL